MSERRAVPRQRTFLKGVLASQSGNASEDCLVRNLSSGGAQLLLPHPNAPDAFELLIPARDMRRRARAVWRHGDHVGVRFEAGSAAAPPRPQRGSADDGRY